MAKKKTKTKGRVIDWHAACKKACKEVADLEETIERLESEHKSELEFIQKEADKVGKNAKAYRAGEVRNLESALQSKNWEMEHDREKSIFFRGILDVMIAQKEAADDTEVKLREELRGVREG